MKTKLELIPMDSTHNWSKDFLKGMEINRVRDICLVDKSRMTNLCEIVPSYEIIPLYSDPAGELSDSQLDEFDYNNTLEEFYLHCNFVDSLEAVNCNDLNFKIRDDTDYYNRIEEIKDLLQANRRL